LLLARGDNCHCAYPSERLRERHASGTRDNLSLPGLCKANQTALIEHDSAAHHLAGRCQTYRVFFGCTLHRARIGTRKFIMDLIEPYRSRVGEEVMSDFAAVIIFELAGVFICVFNIARILERSEQRRPS
jgi:hypothetical protein